MTSVFPVGLDDQGKFGGQGIRSWPWRKRWELDICKQSQGTSTKARSTFCKNATPLGLSWGHLFPLYGLMLPRVGHNLHPYITRMNKICCVSHSISLVSFFFFFFFTCSAVRCKSLGTFDQRAGENKQVFWDFFFWTHFQWKSLCWVNLPFVCWTQMPPWESKGEVTLQDGRCLEAESCRA